MKFEPKDIEIIEPIIEKSILKILNDWKINDFEKKIYNITQTAEMLGKAYNWVSDRMKDETLKTTSDGKHVTGKEINKYLGNC